MLHVEAPTGVAAGEGLGGTVEVDHGAVDVSAETSRRLSCDASVVPIRSGTDDTVLDIGRKTRTVPPSIRRALEARDRSCRFPGCTARRCDAHHVEHWMDGGDTSVKNLVLLCRRHHRAVHEGEFDVMRQADGTVTFLRANGTVLEAAPALPAGSPALAVLTGADAIPVWDGTPFDVVYAIDVLYAPRGCRAAACGAASALDV
jgi:hypothetical protein